MANVDVLPIGSQRHRRPLTVVCIAAATVDSPAPDCRPRPAPRRRGRRRTAAAAAKDAPPVAVDGRLGTCGAVTARSERLRAVDAGASHRARAPDARQPLRALLRRRRRRVAKPSATSSRRVAKVLSVRLLMLGWPRSRAAARARVAGEAVHRDPPPGAAARGWRGPAAGGCAPARRSSNKLASSGAGSTCGTGRRECARQCTANCASARARRSNFDRLRVPDAPSRNVGVA